MIQEAGDEARPFEGKLRELAAVPADLRLTADEIAAVMEIGDNTGSMALKGASARHTESPRPDEWPLRPDLAALATRHNLGQSW